MANDQVLYDYDVIEQCVTLMKNKANEIAGDVKELQTDVKNIMVNWEGTSAQAYESLSTDLVADLGKHNDYLEQLKVKLEAAASGMQGSDSDWGKKILANGG
ncbi:WXG100 family type VII secretion target [Actinokineospora spheciospongiae]|uniref:WXG100 family type VII secretion target n=1 Tax=Actinokineospora spheciospongiae TaxID=909613 RepID=UPI000D71BA5B|nr:WXG100 family type VII secretion target [Actinokineospora spheciospongiae]PWW63304.1 WXG100 family type VII secretion target [Actinokineospora spheciospongiae]